MKRRDLLRSAGTVAAAQLLGVAIPGCGGSSSGNVAGSTLPGTGGNIMEEDNELQLAVAACLAAGDACLAHCLRALSQGDTSLADCAKSVVVMIPVCDAVGTLADNDSRHLRAIAALCRDVCQDCGTACEPHAHHHRECADCLEACRRVIAVAGRVAGDA